MQKKLHESLGLGTAPTGQLKKHKIEPFLTLLRFEKNQLLQQMIFTSDLVYACNSVITSHNQKIFGI